MPFYQRQTKTKTLLLISHTSYGASAKFMYIFFAVEQIILFLNGWHMISSFKNTGDLLFYDKF